LVSSSKSSASKEFEKFLKGLQDNLNPSVTKEDAIEMLAQHLITKPIFEALFEGYSFSNDNPVSLAMQRMIEILSESNVDLEADSLENFYAEMKTTIGGINTSDGRQKIIKDLYEKFFKLAFPSAAAQLGIVYTPNEVVDFMLQSVNDILQKEFKSDLGDRNVQILDPFTGTGTFVARLLQLGIIPKDKLEHKYMNEIHANEIVLLAYYIAAVNIEETFHSVMGGEYKPFEGIVLTDTFQMDEADDSDEIAGLEVFPENNQKVKGQRKRDIRVVIGNPPYALAQASGNENAERATYPKLDTRIQQTYAARSKASLTKSLSNSYIRAIRWASDRIADEGVICFVSNGGFIDDNSADGLRQALVEEFSSVYIYNLRGNQRTSGETSRKEGGKIFGSGSRNTIAISILVKNPKSGSSGGIFYRDIGDYLTREQKLAKLKREVSLSKVEWDQLVPNLDGDWINQKDAEFTSLPSLSHKADGPYSVFGMYSRSLLTSRDSWAYNFSRKSLEANVSSMIDFYNEQVALLRELSKTQKISEDTVKEKVSLDPTKISWDGNLVKLASKLKELTFNPEDITESLYRPFTKHWVYLNKSFLNSAYQIPSLFPKGESNFGFIVPGPGSAVPFSVLMTNRPSDLSQFGGQTNAHFFARYTFPEEVEEDALFGSSPLTDGKADNITDECLVDFQSVYGKQLTKDDIFFYVYGLLHSPDYRQRFESDLRKGLPRIMKVADFKGFSKAGRELSELHMQYETSDEYPLTEDSLPKAKSEVVKMRFGKSGGKEDKSKLVLNETLTLHGIPEKAFEYKIGSRSPIEWLVERYVRKIDKDTGLLVDANAWGLERSQEDYLVSLIKRVVNVSVETVQIVEKLPGLDLHPKAVS
jgi:predicted helicase